MRRAVTYFNLLKSIGRSIVVALTLATAGVSAAGSTALAEGWIDTWAAAPQPVWGPEFFAPLSFPRNLWNQTTRQIARASLGGKQVRIKLSNEYGDRPMLVGGGACGPP